MAERLSEKERLKELETDPKLYYDYEGRFIKQKLEQERMDHLPRVVTPAMFAKGGGLLALGKRLKTRRALPGEDKILCDERIRGVIV